MSSTGVTSPVNAAIQANKGSNAQIGQIIKLPNALQNSARAVRLEGQITSQNPNNNTVNIQTEQGNVEVRINGNKQPQVGQRVEIEIPAGRQPRQTIIHTDQQQNTSQQPRSDSNLSTRVTAPTSTTQTTTITRDTPQQAAQTTTQAVKNTTAQPLPPALQEALATKTITAAPPRAITPEALVRLLAVPPAQAQNIARDFTFALPSPTTNIIDKTIFQAIVTANQSANNINAPTANSTPALQTLITVAPLPTATLLNQTVQNTTSIITPNTLIGNTQTPIVPAAPAQQTVISQPSLLNTAPPLQSAQLSSPNLSNTILNTLNTTPITNTATQAPSTAASIPITQNATLTPITFDPTNPTQINTARLSQIDIQIVKITPPDVTIKIPTINTHNLPPPTPIPAATQFTPPIISANNASAISAQVTGFTAQGLPLLTVQGLGGRLPQSFILQQASPNLQLGSQLQIIPKNGVPIAGQLSSVAAQSARNPLLMGFQWPALDTLHNTLQQISPQAANSLTRALPNVGQPAQMGAAAIVFIAAVKSGNFDLLLGDKKMEMLQQAGRRSILSSMTQDTARAGAPEPAVQSDWRAVPLPMYWDNEIHKITLYTRNENQSANQDQNGEGQTRFIFDLNLTRMGDVQIDGLIKDKRLDLILRTQNAFSEPMQQTMRQAYTSALGQTDLTGELNFQGSIQNWVHVLEQEETLGVSI